MDFNNIKDIVIPNNKRVRYLDWKKGTGSILRLWIKPPEYPCHNFIVKMNLAELVEGQERITYYTYTDWEDKLGTLVAGTIACLTLFLADTPPWYYSFPDHELINPDSYFYDGYMLHIGDEFLSTVAFTELEQQSYDYENLTRHVPRGWITTDDLSGKIKLYATADAARTGHLQLWGAQTVSGHRYFETEHETDVLVDVDRPLITLSDKGQTSSTKVIYAPTQSADFEYYKLKYETATGGKFPKSEYPYLNGITRLAYKFPIHTGRLDGTIDYWYGFYIVFVCKR